MTMYHRCAPLRCAQITMYRHAVSHHAAAGYTPRACDLRSLQLILDGYSSLRGKLPVMTVVIDRQIGTIRK